MRLVDRLAVAEFVDRNGGLMAVLHRPDDVLRAERRVAAEKHLRQRRLKGDLVHLGHVPLVEFDADVALDPGKGVLLADGENHVVAREELLAEHAGRLDVAVLDVVLESARTSCP